MTWFSEWELQVSSRPFFSFIVVKDLRIDSDNQNNLFGLYNCLTTNVKMYK